MILHVYKSNQFIFIFTRIMDISRRDSKICVINTGRPLKYGTRNNPSVHAIQCTSCCMRRTKTIRMAKHKILHYL